MRDVALYAPSLSMAGVRQISGQADFPGDRNRDTLNSKPRNPTKRSTRPLFLFHTTTSERRPPGGPSLSQKCPPAVRARQRNDRHDPNPRRVDHLSPPQDGWTPSSRPS